MQKLKSFVRAKMQFKGAWVDLSKNLVIPLDNENLSIARDFVFNQKDKFYNLEIKEYREKRSLNANSYFWLLVSKISEVIKTSNNEIYNKMLCDYGQMQLENNSPVMISILSKINILKLQDEIYKHLKVIGEGEIKGKKFTHYVVMRGSSTYNTSEFSTLLNGTISECKDLGIETLTKSEINSMLNEWGK
jgi:hypothetical protein